MADGRPTTGTATSAVGGREQPRAHLDEGLRADLGWAVHGRAGDVVVAVRERLERDAEPAGGGRPQAYALIAEADRLATQVIGRWIATGTGASAEEKETLARLGEAVEEFSLPGMLKAYFAWRDATCDLIEEEAARLEMPEYLLPEIQAVVEQSCDASLVQMARDFDRQRLRLQGELVAERAKLAHQALHDPLTGLANRTLLFDRLGDVLVPSADGDAVHAVLYLDLDDFKAVNDAFGHDAGDMVLIAVANRLRHAVRPTDTVARCGGDEFVIFCPGLEEGQTEAEGVAQRVLESIERPFSLPDNEVSISGSIGIAVAVSSEGAERLVCRADAEMYVAKERGGRGQSVSVERSR
jgi:diguanylate cyclase (GGDEF)-like protein